MSRKVAVEKPQIRLWCGMCPVATLSTRESRIMSKISIIVFVCLSFALAGFGQDAASGSQIDRAIAVLRKIDVDALSQEERQKKAEAIDRAWKVLKESGDTGRLRLKNEINQIDAGKETDHFFKLNAAALLWEMGKEAESKTIASIWNTTPLSAQYNYVFYTAIEAARTKNPEVLPMLEATLKDAEGNVFFAAHSMPVYWSLTHEFIWGAYGAGALPNLQRKLETSENEVEVVSAMLRLTQAQHLPALPTIRKLASDERQQVRLNAIKSLGTFGHPQDFELLISGLKSAKGEEVFFYAFALYEFDDERAVPHLIPFLAEEEPAIKQEVMLALLRLLTPESFEAVKNAAEKVKDEKLKRFISRSILLRQEKLPDNFTELERNEQIGLLDRVRNKETYLSPDARLATKEQLREAIKEWTEKGRIYGSSFEWLGIPQMVAVGSADDIPALLEAKSKIYLRLSDEALYETRDLDTVIKYLGRKRYRKGVGVTTAAELSN